MELRFLLFGRDDIGTQIDSLVLLFRQLLGASNELVEDGHVSE